MLCKQLLGCLGITRCMLTKCLLDKHLEMEVWAVLVVLVALEALVVVAAWVVLGVLE